MKKSYIINVFSFLLLFLLVGFISTTPDWHIYEYYFSNNIINRGLTFFYATQFIKSIGGNFKTLHLLYTGITSALLIFFISRFTSRTLLVLLLFIPSIIVFYSTQIRFYLALSLTLNALYTYKFGKNRLFPLLLFLFAFFSHYASMFFLPFFFLLKLDVRHFKAKIIIYALLMFSIFFLFMDLIFPISIAESYLTTENESSFLGSFYNYIPYILSLILIKLFVNAKQIMNISKNDEKIDFLYKMAHLPYLYLPIAFQYQIIGRRFIYPILLFQILLALYTKNYSNIIQFVKFKSAFWLFIFLHIIYIYFLPFLIWGSSPRLNNIILIISSNTLFK